MKRVVFSVFGISLVLSLLFGSATQAETPHELFLKGNQAYEKGNYSQALDAYENLLQQNGPQADILYNMGHAAHRLGQSGLAVFYFEQALRLRPRDPDARFNRDFIQPNLDAQWQQLLGWNYYLLNVSSQGLYTAVLVLGVGFLVIGLLVLWRRSRIGAIGMAVCFLLWIVSGVLLSAKVHSKPWGIITQSKVTLQSSLSPASLALKELPEKTPFVVLEQRDNDWLLIVEPDGQKGWIQQDDARVSE